MLIGAPAKDPPTMNRGQITKIRQAKEKAKEKEKETETETKTEREQKQKQKRKKTRKRKRQKQKQKQNSIVQRASYLKPQRFPRIPQQ